MSFNRSILVTSLTGASGAGGTLIYQYAVPGTGTEVLIKEGYYFLDSDNEYKAVASDHKNLLNEPSLKLQNSNNNDIHSKIKEGCKTQLLATYARDFKQHTNITNLCTHNGIITVKGRLIAVGQNNFIEDDSNSEKHYKIAFGIYRYHNRFMQGIKKFTLKEVPNGIKIETTTASGGKGLEEACGLELVKLHREIKDPNYYQDISWGCQKYKYEKIKELIMSKDPDGELEDNFKGRADLGKHTKKIKERLQGGNTSGSGAKVDEFSDSTIEKYCKSSEEQELEHNDAYQERYLILRYVCKKQKNK